MKPCKCIEAEIDGKRDPRIENLHDCAYVEWRNRQVPIAERLAYERVRREGLDPSATVGPGTVRFGAIFHEEMNRLCNKEKGPNQ